MRFFLTMEETNPGSIQTVLLHMALVGNYLTWKQVIDVKVFLFPQVHHVILATRQVPVDVLMPLGDQADAVASPFLVKGVSW